MIVQVSRFYVWNSTLRKLRHETTADLHYFWIDLQTFWGISHHSLDTLVEASVSKEVYLGVRLSLIKFYIRGYLLIWSWHFYFFCIVYLLLYKSESLFLAVFLALLNFFLLIFNYLIIYRILRNLPPFLLAGIVLALLLLIDVLLHSIKCSDARPVILCRLFHHRCWTADVMMVPRLQVLHTNCLVWEGDSKLGGERSLALARIWVWKGRGFRVI